MKIELLVSTPHGPYEPVNNIKLPAAPRLGDRVEYDTGRFGTVKDVRWLLKGAVRLNLERQL